MRVITILKTGGDFKAEHFVAIRKQVDRFAPGVPTICLTDDPEALELPGTFPLRHLWAGWWSKIEVFRFPGPCLYVDLDTVIVDDIVPLLKVAQTNDFTVLRDFNPHQRVMGSGLMAWSGSVYPLYELFEAQPSYYIDECKSPRWFGDQGYIERMSDHMGLHRTYWQDLLPGAVVSYKKDCLTGVPRSARVVCFHGKPRPWQVEPIGKYALHGR